MRVHMTRCATNWGLWPASALLGTIAKDCVTTKIGEIDHRIICHDCISMPLLISDKTINTSNAACVAHAAVPATAAAENLDMPRGAGALDALCCPHGRHCLESLRQIGMAEQGGRSGREIAKY